jgi:hypothetical protein
LTGQAGPLRQGICREFLFENLGCAGKRTEDAQSSDSDRRAGVPILSLRSHDAAHDYVADRLGDSTARERGRLTLNPLPHIDLFHTIVLPLFLLWSHRDSSSAV